MGTTDQSGKIETDKTEFEPPGDTLDWDSVFQRSIITRPLRWTYYLVFNSKPFRSLGFSKERFTCICGEETDYLPRFELTRESDRTTRCSNDLCPMIHINKWSENKSILKPRNMVWCQSCHTVESKEGYSHRQNAILNDLRQNKWIPEPKHWSDQLNPKPEHWLDLHHDEDDSLYLTDAPALNLDYGRPGSINGVRINETTCVNCWLEEIGVDVDKLQQDAHKREKTENLTINNDGVYSPLNDTLNWNSSIFSGWIRRTVTWLYYHIFNSETFQSSGITEEKFTCICGTETSYLPKIDYIDTDELITHCSNDLCPMVHVAKLKQGTSVLEPRHFVQCQGCGDVDSQEGYQTRQRSIERAFRDSPRGSDWYDWSDQIGILDGQTPLSEYHSEVPYVEPNDLDDVEVLDTTCIKCWLDGLNVNVTELQEKADDEKESEKIPYHEKRRREQKRRHRNKWMLLSILPTSFAFSLVNQFVASQLGIYQEVIETVGLPPWGFSTLPLSVTISSILQMGSLLLSFFGAFVWVLVLTMRLLEMGTTRAHS